MQGNASEEVAAPPRQRRETSPFGAKHERHGVGTEIEVEHGAITAFVQPHRSHAESLEALKRARDARHEGDREVLDRSGCRLGHCGCHMDGPMPWQNCTGGSSALSAAQDRSEILRIGDAIDNYEKRARPPRHCRAPLEVLTVVVLALLAVLVLVLVLAHDELSEVMGLERLGEGNYTLGGLGPPDGIELPR